MSKSTMKSKKKAKEVELIKLHKSRPSPRSQRIEDAVLPEFRFNFRRKHPCTVFKREGEVYKSILITHSSKTSGRKNVVLLKNPSPKDNRHAYLVKKVYRDYSKSFAKHPYKGWSFDKSDNKSLKRIKRNKKKS